MQVLAATAGADLEPLARNSPGLRGYAWSEYLTASLSRIVRAAGALRRFAAPGARVLDYGSYFGNFSLALARLGYRVEAVDSYRTYGAAFAAVQDRLRVAGVEVLDFAEVGHGLKKLPAGSYDAVLAMGVIEHIPHTPRLFLEAVDRVLCGGGLLILDTPNLAYIYRRQQLARGESIFCPIALQYHTELPFEGHHREYTAAEVRWMLGQLGHEELLLDLFVYSLLVQPRLQGQDLQNYRQCLRDPGCREVIFSVSRKPAGRDRKVSESRS